jgi:hypothetical protein
MIHKANNKHGAKKPKRGWSTSTVHDIVGHALTSWILRSAAIWC